MAGKASLIIELKDQVTSGLSKLTKMLDGLGLASVAVGASLAAASAAVVAFARDSFASFQQSEIAVNRLNQALKAQGFFSESYSQALQDQAAALQSVTTFSDEAILETQALLTTFGLAGAQMQTTTKAALDLASGLGIDLRTATMLLGKAWAGETGTLSRYGFVISDTLPKAQRFEEALRQINARFGGAAESELNTYAGKVQNLANEWDQVKEAIGGFLVGPATGIVNWLREATVAMQDFFNVRAQEKIKDRVEAIKSEVAALNLDMASISRHAAETEASTAIIDQKRQKVAELEAELAKLTATQNNLSGPGSKAAGGDSPKEPDLGDADFSDAVRLRLSVEAADQARMEREAIALNADARELERAGLQAEALATIRAEKQAAELIQLGQHESAKLLLEEQSSKNSEAISKRRFESMRTALSMLASLSNAKTKEIAVFGKAAAMAQTIINAHLAAGAAMAAFASIPPLALTMGAMMEAAGLAQAAQIAGVPLAQGGMIMPSNGGTLARMAEVGKPEVAIPLDDERTAEKLRAALGGHSQGHTININLNGTVIDRNAVRELTAQIDEELYKLRHNKLSVTFGSDPTTAGKTA